MKKFFLAAVLVFTAALSVVSSAQAGAPVLPAFAYMATNTGDFGTINLNTGAFSLQGNSGLTLAGLALNNSNLYGVSYNNGSALYRVNPTNGSLTFLGNSGITYDDFGSTSAGLFAVSTSANLYSISPSTGAASLIGPIGVGLAGFRSLSNNGSSLYFASGNNIYTLNTTNGAATLVGLTGGAGLGAMLFLNGTLYGGQDSPDIRVDTLNQANGSATAGPAVTGTTGQFYGLAPIPEPTTLASLLLGSVLVVAGARRRRAQRA